jgi:hypothetical protein
MPTSVGPNTFGEENLVFGYDLGDTVNSYRGEPTTNLASLDLSNAKWYSEGGTKVLQSETLDGYPVYRFRSSGSLIYVSPLAFNQLTVTSNDVTLSAYFKNVGTSAQTVNVFLANDFGTDSNGDPNNRSIPADGKWYRQSWTRYAAANTYNQVEFRTFSDTLLISKPQVEYKKHVTPPVEGTRSATQGLLDLTGNRTIDLSNVSFDSNAQMTFDGTNDSVLVGTVGNYSSNMTVEAVFKTSSSATWKNILCGSTGDIIFTVNGTKLNFGSQGNTPIPHANYSTTDVNDGQWHHGVATYNGSQVKVYVDGVLESTNSRSGNQTPSSLRVGSNNAGSSEFFNGDIPLVKLYNRALTADEVRNNYNQYRTRFNI